MRSRPGLGITLVLLMGLCFASMDTTVKYMGTIVPVLVVLWARYSVQAVSMGTWLAVSRLRGGGAGFRSAHPRFQVARGGLLLLSSTCGFYGLQNLPVAEFTAINMLTPVIVTVLAGWMLRERVSWLRWLLVAGGLLGALIVIRPGSGLFGWAVLLPLAGALAYASFQVLTSKLSGLESPYTTHFYTGLTGSVVIALLLIASSVDVWPTLAAAQPHHLFLLLMIGALGTAGHLMLIVAFGLARTTILMPFMYAQIGFAALVSWVVFRQLPDGWGWLGMAVIAISGGTSAWLNVREAIAKQQNSALTADSIVD
jgi:drug/metabolite transporter (DMT)-like permease